jgi:hypothetical protein
MGIIQVSRTSLTSLYVCLGVCSGFWWYCVTTPHAFASLLSLSLSPPPPMPPFVYVTLKLTLVRMYVCLCGVLLAAGDGCAKGCILEEVPFEEIGVTAKIGLTGSVGVVCSGPASDVHHLNIRNDLASLSGSNTTLQRWRIVEVCARCVAGLSPITVHVYDAGCVSRGGGDADWECV